MIISVDKELMKKKKKKLNLKTKKKKNLTSGIKKLNSQFYFFSFCLPVQKVVFLIMMAGVFFLVVAISCGGIINLLLVMINEVF